MRKSKKKQENSSTIRKKIVHWCETNVTLVRNTRKNLAVVLHNQYMTNVQNFIQIVYLILYARIYGKYFIQEPFSQKD